MNIRNCLITENYKNPKKIKLSFKIFSISVIICICLCFFSSCNLCYKPLVNAKIENITPIVNENKEITIDLNDIKHEEINIVKRYPFFPGFARNKFWVNDNLILDNYGLLSISPESKKLNWFKSDYKFVQNGDFIINDKIFCLSTECPSVNCLNLNTGNTIWSYSYDEYYMKNNMQPNIYFADENILIILEPRYSNTEKGIIRACDPNTGKTIWEFDNENKFCHIINANRKLLLTISDTTLIGIDTYSGKKLRSIYISDIDYIHLNNTFNLYPLSNNNVFYNDFNTLGFLFNPVNGKILNNKIHTGSLPNLELDLQSSDKYVFNKDQAFCLGKANNNIYVSCIDLISMRELWRTLISTEQNQEESTELAIKGNFQFKECLPDKIFLSADSNLIVKNDKKYHHFLFCLNRFTGQIEWANDEFNFDNRFSYTLKGNFQKFYNLSDKGFELISNPKDTRNIPQEMTCIDLKNGKGLLRLKINNGYIDDLYILRNIILINAYKDTDDPWGETSTYILINPENGEIIKIFSKWNKKKKYSIVNTIDEYENTILLFNNWIENDTAEILQISYDN